MLITVTPHKVIIDKDIINEREIDITKCEFEFADEITDDFVKQALFTFKGKTYEQIIVDNECQIPYEVLTEKGQVEIGVVAFKTDGVKEIKRYNPSPAYFNTWTGSLKDEIENSQPITPSEMEQYEQKLNDGLVEVNRINIDATKVDDTTTITITKKDGSTKEIEILDGVDGKDGADGIDGLTPTIGNNGNWYVGDEDTGKPSRGQQGVQGERGETGQAGRDGIDGVSPTVTTSKSGTVTTIEITDKNGTHTATINDGINGSNGRDGQNGRDGYMQYTAGDNITIENGIISAIGGGSIEEVNLTAGQHQLYNYANGIYKINATENGVYVLPRVGAMIGIPNGGFILYVLYKDTVFDYYRVGIVFNGDFIDFYKIDNRGNRVTDKKSIWQYSATLRDGALMASNTEAFTPTGNYNPATKKYVDEKVNTAIGNINSVLATLTSVEEL